MFCSTDFQNGQTTVEAAFLLPVLMVLIGLALQPMLILFDRCVMEAAAAESCRMACTNTASEGQMRAFVKRRLAAIPNLAIFHIGGEEGWKVSINYEEDAPKVRISHKVQTLPLVGVATGLYARLDASRRIVQVVQVCSSALPDWVYDLEDEPDDWIAQWE